MHVCMYVRQPALDTLGMYVCMQGNKGSDPFRMLDYITRGWGECNEHACRAVVQVCVCVCVCPVTPVCV